MLRVPVEGLVEGELRMSPDTSRYLARVHRLAPGDRFVGFDPVARLEADGELLEAGRACRVRFSAPRAASRVAHRDLQLIQALPKGAKIDAIVRDATELGATRLTVVRARRSVKQGIDLARLRRIAIEAARQCGRGDLPVIEAVEDLSAALTACRAERRMCLHDAGETAFREAVGPGATALLVGPEGGWAGEELTEARAAGFALVRLGAFTMRTETACAAALGALAALTAES